MAKPILQWGFNYCPCRYITYITISKLGNSHSQWWFSFVVWWKIWQIQDLKSFFWWYTNPSEKYESQWEGWHPIYEMENKIHVPNHQPESISVRIWVWQIRGAVFYRQPNDPTGSSAIWGSRATIFRGIQKILACDLTWKPSPKQKSFQWIDPTSNPGEFRLTQTPSRWIQLPPVQVATDVKQGRKASEVLESPGADLLYSPCLGNDLHLLVRFT